MRQVLANIIQITTQEISMLELKATMIFNIFTLYIPDLNAIRNVQCKVKWWISLVVRETKVFQGEIPNNKLLPLQILVCHFQSETIF